MAISVFAIGVMAGCSSSPSAPSATGGPVYPKGIATDAASLQATKGIYLGDSLCCWLGKEAQFAVPASNDAKSVVLTFAVPTAAPLAKMQQVVLMSANGSTVSKKLSGGHDTMSLPIRSGMVVDGMLTVHLTMSNAFIPKKIGLNGDVRPLSVVLQSALAI